MNIHNFFAIHKARRSSYPEVFVKRIFFEMCIILICSISFISIFLCRIGFLWPVLAAIIFVCCYDSFRLYYVCFFGKWKKYEGKCLTDNNGFHLKSRIKIQFVVENGEDSGIYDFSTSKNNIFTKGQTICIYTQDCNLLETNGIKHISVIYHMKVI